MSMREGMLVIPRHDNKGRDIRPLRDEMISTLIGMFGGCTAVNASGFWNSNDGKFFEEPVTQLVVACEDNVSNDRVLRSLAERIGRKAEQLAVYVRFPSGAVEVINTSAAQLAA